MKKGILALVLVLLVSMFTQPCFAAEAKDLVTFDSYDARKYDSNGIRVIYTFDTTTLAELEMHLPSDAARNVFEHFKAKDER